MEEDRISELPEEIAVKILSLLPIKEAVFTSALSRRWRYVWTCTSNLDFDGEEYPMKTNFYDPKLVELKFINWVDSVIDQHRHRGSDNQMIDRFRVYFDLNRSHTDSIDAWVKFAMGKKGLQIFALEFPEYHRSVARSYNNYILHYRQVFEYNHISYFNSLRVLRFIRVDMKEEVVHHLLSNCPVLERLELLYSSTLVYLKDAGPSLALKHLTVQYCDDIDSIEICDADNLVSFYCCFKDPSEQILVIKNAPNLVDVYLFFYKSPNLCSSHVFTMLSCCLSQIQILQLNIAVQDYVENCVYPTLQNLKQLELILDRCDFDNSNLLKIIRFFKAFPCMQKLVLKLLYWFDGRSEDEKEKQRREYCMKPTKCPHHYLKEVEILGYSGRASDVELITYFVENAVSLEKIIIKSFVFREYPMDLHCLTYPPTKQEEEMARHVMKHVKQNIIPSTIQFICP